MIRLRRARPAAALTAALTAALAAAALLAGCAESGDATPAPTRVTSSLDDVTVTGNEGQKPAVKVPTPFTVEATDRKVLSAGRGEKLTPGQRITIDYVGVNGTDGKEFDTSFGKPDRTTFTLDQQQIIKGMVTGLSGTSVGSRVLIAVPPKDAYGTQGAPAARIGPTDTLLFVVDVVSAGRVLERAQGTPVKPRKGLPTVALESSGKPKIALPGGAAPASLVVQPLIVGKGPKVAKGQTVTVHYTGVIWPGGRQFDSSWDRKSPASFAIGTGRVISGWDAGLVGQTVGSQVLLVIPPDRGYGASGQPSAGIKGTDTLVFVVDVLDAAA